MSQVVRLELTPSGLKSYSGRKPLDFEVWKRFLADKTVIEDLANGTVQK